MFGRIVHEMLEANANGDDPFDILDAINIKDAKLFASEKEQYGEIINDISLIMEDYFEYYPERELVYVKVGDKYAEHKFEIELLGGEVIWNGKVDALGKTPNKLKWVVEHKTFTKMPGEDERWRNLQSVTYFEAIDILGWGSVDGVVWDYIRSKSPPRPGLLKDGSMSKKAVDTLPGAVREALRRHKIPMRPYTNFIVSMEKNRPNWFKRIHTPVGAEVKKKVFADFVTTIKEMLVNHGKVKDMNIERHCSWCDYEPLCRAELQGLDVDYIKQKEYVVDDKDYHETNTDDTTTE